MNNDCAVVRDLLPLYVDGACSEPSRELVEDHLRTCADCAALRKTLQSSLPEETLNAEMTGVMRRQEKRFRRRSALAGAIIGGILLVPVLICLIVILASGHGFDWFFIVLASLLLAASVTVVPLAVPENRLCWTLGSFLVALLLLLGICCGESGGSWFFVAASASTFGLALLFLPVAVYAEPLRSALGKRKGLTVMLADTALYALMMLSIGFYVRSPYYAPKAFWISLPFVLLAWAIFVIVRYTRCGGLVKAGFCTVLCALFLFFAELLVNGVLGYPVPLPEFHPLIWNAATLDGNILWAILLTGLLVGLIFVIADFLRHRRKKDET